MKQRSETTTIFAVDASGSAAMHRLAEVKGAVELLLADCYVRRDQVALLSFRGRTAELSSAADPIAGARQTLSRRAAGRRRNTARDRDRRCRRACRFNPPQGADADRRPADRWSRQCGAETAARAANRLRRTRLHPRDYFACGRIDRAGRRHFVASASVRAAARGRDGSALPAAAICGCPQTVARSPSCVALALGTGLEPVALRVRASSGLYPAMSKDLAQRSAGGTVCSRVRLDRLQRIRRPAQAEIACGGLGRAARSRQQGRGRSAIISPATKKPSHCC